MAAAEERSPGDQEEEEEEVVSATAEACAVAVMAAPAVCGEGSRDAARGTEAFAPGRAEPGRGWPQPYSVVRMGAVEEVALGNVACFLALKVGPGFH